MIYRIRKRARGDSPADDRYLRADVPKRKVLSSPRHAIARHSRQSAIKSTLFRFPATLSDVR